MILGNATEITTDEVDLCFGDVLLDGETVERGFKVIRDVWLFTSLRLIILDIQGFTGKKQSFHTIPYKSIRHFSIETAGTFDDDCDMYIYVASMDSCLHYEFSKGVDVISIQKMLAEHICR